MAQRPAVVRQIVVMGGGGFSSKPANLLLDQYVVRQTRKRRPRACFVPTASGDSTDYIHQFYKAYEALGCRASHLPLFSRDARNLAAFLLEQDLIYVGGGNTANLLDIWRRHGVDRIMRQAWRRGIILCGLSAGMICWFQCSVTDSFGPLAALNDGLGFLSGSACPHYDGEPMRRPTYHRLIARGFPAGVAADDGAAIHYVARKIHRCVASRPAAQAYRVRLKMGQVLETPLPMSYLGNRKK